MNKRLIIFFATSILFANQASAGIFGPSNFEECVLENLKNAKNELAVRAVYAMCGDKFDKPSKSSNPTEKPSEKMFTGLHNSRPTLHALINKIEITTSKIEKSRSSAQLPYTLKLYVTNRNDFLVEAVSVAILKSGKKTCSWEEKDYAEFYVCVGDVHGYGSGAMECDIPNVNNRPAGWGYCITGIGFRTTESDSNKFMKKYSIPPLKK